MSDTIFFAVTGLGLVLYFVIQNHGEGPITSLVLFAIAALGGLVMFTIDMMGKRIPKAFAIIHPVIAVSALAALLIYVMR